MPTSAGSTQRRAAAGWYRDPVGTAGQLRWWDGKAWGPASAGSSGGGSPGSEATTVLPGASVG